MALRTVSSAYAPFMPLSSQVVADPLAAQVLGALLFGLGLLSVLAGAMWGWYVAWPAGSLGLALGAALLAAAWWLSRRSYYSLRLTLTADALHLAPIGRSARQGVLPETIPLTAIRAYSHWQQQGRVLTQHYLRLELAGGRVLRLADRPGALPDDPPGTVLLATLVPVLAQCVPPATVLRPPFYQSAAGRRLAYAAGAAGALGGLLLARHWLATGAALLALASSYLIVYYLRNRPTTR